MNLISFRKPFLFAALASALVFTSSCENDKEEASPFSDGVFVTNEGQFNSVNAEVSFISRDGKTVIPALFNQVNNRPLGDAAQSMTFIGDKAYIVVNNSQKIEVVDGRTFSSTGVINDLSIPRYMAALNNNKAYVTEYVGYSFFGYTGTGRVSVLNLANNTVTKTIDVGLLPEGALLHNGKLYVANSGGSTVSIINTSTDAVEATLEVGNGPAHMVLDANNKIWVIRGTYGEPGALVKIDPANNHAITSYQIPGSGLLTINGSKNTLYYSSAGKIYSMSVTATAAPTTPLISRNPYGLGLDPESNKLYLGVGGYTTNGWVVRYETTGARIDSFQVRVLPNGFTFR
ncbi:YncE family protein [Nibribacter koreensis]|uniref:40-residue YVTN family beta-propeller repeat-containing protein n=1 Tax=Nibribacter koreensis TaxID=1084519 RepID=A0ABP8FKZ4_9BACT